MSRYIKITLTGGKFNTYQPILARISNTKLYPISEITYNSTTDLYEAGETADLRRYYLPVAIFNNTCLLYWRESIDDVNNLGSELEDLLDNCIDGTTIDYDIEIANIDDYSDYVNVHNYQTSVLEFPEWTYGGRLVKRV